MNMYNLYNDLQEEYSLANILSDRDDKLDKEHIELLKRQITHRKLVKKSNNRMIKLLVELKVKEK